VDSVFIAYVGAIHFQLKIGASVVLGSSIAVNNESTSLLTPCQAYIKWKNKKQEYCLWYILFHSPWGWTQRRPMVCFSASADRWE